MTEEESFSQAVRLDWSEDFALGQTDLDAQHRDLLDRCNRLAELCAGADEATGATAFDAAVTELRQRAQVHFADELAWLAQANPSRFEEHKAECDDFEYLLGEIATTQHFSRLELQRFLAVWWLGHLRESAALLGHDASD